MSWLPGDAADLEDDMQLTQGSVVSRTVCFTGIQITVYVEVSDVHRVPGLVMALDEWRQALIEEALH